MNTSVKRYNMKYAFHFERTSPAAPIGRDARADAGRPRPLAAPSHLQALTRLGGSSAGTPRATRIAMTKRAPFALILALLAAAPVDAGQDSKPSQARKVVL